MKTLLAARLVGAIALVAAALVTPARGTEAGDANDTARVLAGLSVSAGSPLAPLEASPSWRAHARNFDAAFGRVDKIQLSRIRDWSKANLTLRRPTLFYMFSGPDFLYADAFFPGETTYVMAGLEPSGPIPNLAKLPKGTMPRVFGALQVSLRSILGLSFFKTKDMSSDLVSGTIPILYVFLARTGHEVHDASLIQLDAAGVAQAVAKPSPKGRASGVKITFSTPGGPEQTLYYFSANVAGSGFQTSGLEAFCDKLGQGDAFIKSASYLLHDGAFAAVRNFLLTHSAMILEDDTGIPVTKFDTSWRLKPYGRYAGPIGLFAGNYQPRMAALFKKGAGAMDFGIGYRHVRSESSLLLAVKREADAKPSPKAEAAPKAEPGPSEPTKPTAAPTSAPASVH